jgi:hypothetical protein
MKTDIRRIWIAGFVFLFVLSIFQPSYGDMTSEQALEAVRTGKWDELPSLIVTPVMEDVNVEGVEGSATTQSAVLQNFSALVQAGGIKNYVKPGLAKLMQVKGTEETSRLLLERDKIQFAMHTYVLNEFEVQAGAALFFDVSANIICRRFVLRKDSNVVRPKNSVLRIIALERVESEEARIETIGGSEDGTMEVDGVTYTIKVGASGAGGQDGQDAQDEGQAAEGQSANVAKAKNGKNGKNGKDGGEVLIISKTLQGNLFVDVTGGDGGSGGNGGKGMDGGFGSPGLDGQDEKSELVKKTRQEKEFFTLDITNMVDQDTIVIDEVPETVTVTRQVKESVPYTERVPYTDYVNHTKKTKVFGFTTKKVNVRTPVTKFRDVTKFRTRYVDKPMQIVKLKKVTKVKTIKVPVPGQKVEERVKDVEYYAWERENHATAGTDGGNGGDGGEGGDGGDGANGGNGGNVTLIIQDTGGYSVHVFTEGGKGGIGGLGGRGGSGGNGGQGGKGGRRFNYQTGEHTDARAPAGKNGLKGKDGVAGVSGESGESGETGNVKMIVDVPEKIWELAATSYIEKQLLGKVPQDAAINRPLVGDATDAVSKELSDALY